MPTHEPVSVAILTKDESDNVAERIDAVLAQLAPGDELIVIDAGSSDRTVAACVRYAERIPDRVRVHAFPEDAGFAEARATARSMARHDALVFVGLRATPQPGWLDAMRSALGNADVVFGHAERAPRSGTARVAPRGGPRSRALPEAFATNLSVAYRRFAFQELGELDENSPDRVARRARLAGLRLARAPNAIVLLPALRAPIAVSAVEVAWAATVGALGVAAIALANVWLLVATLTTFLAPAARRFVTPLGRRQPAPGARRAPIFDLAFVGSFLTRRTLRRG